MLHRVWLLVVSAFCCVNVVLGAVVKSLWVKFKKAKFLVSLQVVVKVYW